MKRLVPYILFLFIILVPRLSLSQDTSTSVVARAIIVNGDTLPIIALTEVKIFGPVIFASKMEALRFSRLVYHVKKVYPYAKIVSIKVQEYNEIINKAKSRKEKKQKMKEAEEELKRQFEDDIRNMNETQGVILLKLIDRETGNSSYDLIKEFRGALTAMFYQTFSRFWGYNLKTKYDPQGEDKDIENIVIMIENGEL